MQNHNVYIYVCLADSMELTIDDKGSEIAKDKFPDWDAEVPQKLSALNARLLRNAGDGTAPLYSKLKGGTR